MTENLFGGEKFLPSVVVTTPARTNPARTKLVRAGVVPCRSPPLRSQVEEWKTQWPYYLSASKKLPHFFVRFDEAFENDRVAKTKFEGIEILSGQWGWCHKAAEIFNAEKDIPVLKKSRWVDEHRVKGASHPQPIKDVNREVNKTPLLYTEVEIKNILYHIDVYYCDGYESWFRIGCALYNSGYAQEVFDEFSKRSTKWHPRCTEVPIFLEFILGRS